MVRGCVVDDDEMGDGDVKQRQVVVRGEAEADPWNTRNEYRSTPRDQGEVGLLAVEAVRKSENACRGIKVPSER